MRSSSCPSGVSWIVLSSWSMASIVAPRARPRVAAASSAPATASSGRLVPSDEVDSRLVRIVHDRGEPQVDCPRPRLAEDLPRGAADQRMREREAPIRHAEETRIDCCTGARLELGHGDVERPRDRLVRWSRAQGNDRDDLLRRRGQLLDPLAQEDADVGGQGRVQSAAREFHRPRATGRARARETGCRG